MNRKRNPRFAWGLLVLFLWAAASPVLPSDEGMPAILSLRDQARLIEQWQRARLETILPDVMRREKIDMWVIICRENNEDPVFYSLLEKSKANRLIILVFFDRGGEGVERLNISRYSFGDLYKNIHAATQEEQWQCLLDVVKERDPKTIGIDESETFALGDGLSASLKKRLVETIGPRFASRLRSAERVALGWLETRATGELDVYSQIVAISHCIIAEAFSRQAITPGVTTTDDLVWWINERIRGLGLSRSFNTEVSVLREKEGKPSEKVIRRGDLVHCDMGISYLRLSSDLQQTAYVLKEGETEVPSGLANVLAQGNRAQDILVAEFKEGRTGNEILAAALRKAKEEGLKTAIFSHPIGFQVHSAGPSIGLWDMQGGVPGWGDYPVFRNTCYAIELAIEADVPEWGHQSVELVLEQDAIFDGEKARFIDGRETKIRLIP